MSRFCIIPARVLDDERFSLTHLRVIAALGQHADKNGWCWPAVSTLAERIKVSRQRVSACIRELKEWGYIEVTPRVRPGDGSQTSNLYRVMFDIGAPVEAVTHAATLQPHVAPLQPHVAPLQPHVAPLQPLEVAPPATSGGCTINDPYLTTNQKEPIKGVCAAAPTFPPLEVSSPAPVLENQEAPAKPAKPVKADALCPADVPAEVFGDFLALRKAKRAPLTSTALAGIRREAVKAGLSMADAIAICCERGWVGFRADWHGVGAVAMPKGKKPAADAFDSIDYGTGGLL